MWVFRWRLPYHTPKSAGVLRRKTTPLVGMPSRRLREQNSARLRLAGRGVFLGASVVFLLTSSSSLSTSSQRFISIAREDRRPLTPYTYVTHPPRSRSRRGQPRPGITHKNAPCRHTPHTSQFACETRFFVTCGSIEEDRGDGRPREQRRGLHELGLQPPSHQPPPTEERTRRGMVRQKVAATAGKGAGVARWERVTSSARCKASLCGLYSF